MCMITQYVPKGKLITVSSGKLPTPNKNGECTSNPKLLPNEHAAANAKVTTPAMTLGVHFPYFDPSVV